MASLSRVDFLGMSAGVAGLRAAVELARHGDVLVVTKESLGESNTHYAQGGIAVTREGAHSLPRILHANGDATGAEISRSLVAFARAPGNRKTAFPPAC